MVDGAEVAGLREAWKRFSRRGPWVLDGISITLAPGSRTAVIGGNGSGKSTLLKTLAGTSRLTFGVAVTPRDVGYVPERVPARMRMTGNEYLAHMGRIRGMTGPASERRTSELFDRFDLQPGPDIDFDALSKGNRQKVMLAQAFLTPVDLLVLDEPFSGLDVAAHDALEDLLDERQSTGTAILMSAHHSSSVPSVDLALTIARGRLEETPAGRAGPVEGTGLMVRVELDRAGEDRDVALITGIARTRLLHDDGRSTLVLSVDRQDLDRLLLVALRVGWSVVAVGPSDSPDPEDRG